MPGYHPTPPRPTPLGLAILGNASLGIISCVVLGSFSHFGASVFQTNLSGVLHLSHHGIEVVFSCVASELEVREGQVLPDWRIYLGISKRRQVPYDSEVSLFDPMSRTCGSKICQSQLTKIATSSTCQSPCTSPKKKHSRQIVANKGLFQKENLQHHV